MTRDGYPLNPPHRLVIMRFDVASGAFAPDRVVDEGDILCWDSARLGSGRIFMTSTFEHPGQPMVATLRFSDDDGRTWSPSRAIPGIDAPSFCPSLAASQDELYLLWSHDDSLRFARAGGRGACEPATR